MPRHVSGGLCRVWKSYKYRFVPWIALNLRNTISVRVVECKDPGIDISATLAALFESFHVKSSSRPTSTDEEIHLNNINIMHEKLGFCIEKRPSCLEGGGIGVTVTRGKVQSGSLVALYPGTLYRPMDPILLPSIANPFVLKCVDGMFVDGNDRGLSRLIYKSCVQRDRIGPYSTADVSWLTATPHNPLAVGQFVNNHTKDHGCNVTYQEYDIPPSFPFSLRSFIPNTYFQSLDQDMLPPVRVVALVAIRDIRQGEELFSSYFTILR